MKPVKLLLVDFMLAALVGLFWTGLAALILQPCWLPAVWMGVTGIVLVVLAFFQAAAMARERM